MMMFEIIMTLKGYDDDEYNNCNNGDNVSSQIGYW